MLRAKNYLKSYYKQYKDDYYSSVLQSFGCWMYYNNFYNEIVGFKKEKTVIDFFNKIVNHYYNNYTQQLLQYSKINIRKNIIKTNSKQYNELKKTKFKVKVTTTNYYTPQNGSIYNFEERVSILPNNRDVTKRKIIFYYKSGDTYHTDYNKSTKVGVDTFQLCILYKIVEKMIDDQLLKNFNEVLITPKIKNHYPEFLKRDLNFNVEYFDHNEYINQMGLYANPFHFYGGTIEAGFTKTKPMLTSTIAIQTPYIKHLEDYLYIPFYFAKGKVFDNEIKIDGYDGDKELQMRFGEKGHNYCERMMKNAKNNSIDSLIKTFIEKIVLLDNSI